MKVELFLAKIILIIMLNPNQRNLELLLLRKIEIETTLILGFFLNCWRFYVPPINAKAKRLTIARIVMTPPSKISKLLSSIIIIFSAVDII